jgi:hypothetical protein
MSSPEKTVSVAVSTYQSLGPVTQASSGESVKERIERLRETLSKLTETLQAYEEKPFTAEGERLQDLSPRTPQLSDDEVDEAQAPVSPSKQSFFYADSNLAEGFKQLVINNKCKINGSKPLEFSILKLAENLVRKLAESSCRPSICELYLRGAFERNLLGGGNDSLDLDGCQLVVKLALSPKDRLEQFQAYKKLLIVFLEEEFNEFESTLTEDYDLSLDDSSDDTRLPFIKASFGECFSLSIQAYTEEENVEAHYGENFYEFFLSGLLAPQYQEFTLDIHSLLGNLRLSAEGLAQSIEQARTRRIFSETVAVQEEGKLVPCASPVPACALSPVEDEAGEVSSIESLSYTLDSINSCTVEDNLRDWLRLSQKLLASKENNWQGIIAGLLTHCPQDYSNQFSHLFNLISFLEISTQGEPDIQKELISLVLEKFSTNPLFASGKGSKEEQFRTLRNAIFYHLAMTNPLLFQTRNPRGPESLISAEMPGFETAIAFPRSLLSFSGDIILRNISAQEDETLERSCGFEHLPWIGYTTTISIKTVIEELVPFYEMIVNTPTSSKGEKLQCCQFLQGVICLCPELAEELELCSKLEDFSRLTNSDTREVQVAFLRKEAFFLDHLKRRANLLFKTTELAKSKEAKDFQASLPGFQGPVWAETSKVLCVKGLSHLRLSSDIHSFIKTLPLAIAIPLSSIEDTVVFVRKILDKPIFSESFLKPLLLKWCEDLPSEGQAKATVGFTLSMIEASEKSDSLSSFLAYDLLCSCQRLSIFESAELAHLYVNVIEDLIYKVEHSSESLKCLEKAEDLLKRGFQKNLIYADYYTVRMQTLSHLRLLNTPVVNAKATFQGLLKISDPSTLSPGDKQKFNVINHKAFEVWEVEGFPSSREVLDILDFYVSHRIALNLSSIFVENLVKAYMAPSDDVIYLNIANYALFFFYTLKLYENKELTDIFLQLLTTLLDQEHLLNNPRTHALVTFLEQNPKPNEALQNVVLKAVKNCLNSTDPKLGFFYLDYLAKNHKDFSPPVQYLGDVVKQACILIEKNENHSEDYEIYIRVISCISNLNSNDGFKQLNGFIYAGVKNVTQLYRWFGILKNILPGTIEQALSLPDKRTLKAANLELTEEMQINLYCGLFEFFSVTGPNYNKAKSDKNLESILGHIKQPDTQVDSPTGARVISCLCSSHNEKHVHSALKVLESRKWPKRQYEQRDHAELCIAKRLCTSSPAFDEIATAYFHKINEQREQRPLLLLKIANRLLGSAKRSNVIPGNKLLEKFLSIHPISEETEDLCIENIKLLIVNKLALDTCEDSRSAYEKLLGAYVSRVSPRQFCILLCKLTKQILIVKNKLLIPLALETLSNFVSRNLSPETISLSEKAAIIDRLKTVGVSFESDNPEAQRQITHLQDFFKEMDKLKTVETKEACLDS